MTDELTDVYGDEPRMVIRLSRTAGGVRTYTVGASLPMRSGIEGDAEAISRVFAVDELVRSLLDNPASHADGLLDGLAPTLAIATLDAKGDKGEDGWYTAESIAAVQGVHVRTVQRQMATAVKSGAIERKLGGGKGKRTLYRVPVATQNGGARA